MPCEKQENHFKFLRFEFSIYTFRNVVIQGKNHILTSPHQRQVFKYFGTLILHTARWSRMTSSESPRLNSAPHLVQLKTTKQGCIPSPLYVERTSTHLKKKHFSRHTIQLHCERKKLNIQTLLHLHYDSDGWQISRPSHPQTSTPECASDTLIFRHRLKLSLIQHDHCCSNIVHF